MKRLTVPYLSQVGYDAPENELFTAISGVTGDRLNEVPWADYPYKPEVHFKLAYTKDSLLLRYSVREKEARAVHRNTNDPVYKDSCVEFFLSFDKRQYYNLEFNCAGVGLIGFGDSEKNRRRHLSRERVEQVKAVCRADEAPSSNGETGWELLLNIPFSVFEAHRITSFNGLTCTGNFYKCGDELATPHFISWSPIDHPQPNFHLPEFFGELLFQ